jgi:hypothetical protein
MTFHGRLKSEKLAGVPTPTVKGDALVKAWNTFSNLYISIQSFLEDLLGQAINKARIYAWTEIF